MSLKEPIHITPLIKDCLLGDAKASLALYNQYNKAMYNIAWRIVRDDQEAEDVMQEAFIKAFEKLSQFSGQVSFGAWLKKIVINKAILAYRKQKKEITSSIEEEHYIGPLAADKAYHEAKTKQKAAMILETIDQLKENYRLSLTLHLIEGLNHEEVAELLDISNSNCRATFSRAKEKLRNTLELNPLWKTL